MSSKNPRLSEISWKDRADAARRLTRVLGIRGPLLARAALGHLRLRGSRQLEREWRDRYDRARRDLLEADPVFHPARQWRLISSMFRLMLGGFGLSSFKSTFGRFLAAYEPHNPRYFHALHHVYLAALTKLDTWNILETLEEPALGENDTVILNGRPVSIDLLQAVEELYTMQRTIGFQRDEHIVFCEIGAGYGRLAHIVLKTMPKARYFIFDLPESLLLAQYYLKTLHPDEEALLYPESTTALDSWSTARIAFGLPHQLQTLPSGSVDVVANIYSFMEMSKAQVAAYFSLIDRLNPRALYLKQHKYEVNLLEGSLLTTRGYPIPTRWKLIHDGTSCLYEDVFEAVYGIRADSST